MLAGGKEEKSQAKKKKKKHAFKNDGKLMYEKDSSGPDGTMTRSETGTEECGGQHAAPLMFSGDLLSLPLVFDLHWRVSTRLLHRCLAHLPSDASNVTFRSKNRLIQYSTDSVVSWWDGDWKQNKTNHLRFTVNDEGFLLISTLVSRLFDDTQLY